MPRLEELTSTRNEFNMGYIFVQQPDICILIHSFFENVGIISHLQIEADSTVRCRAWQCSGYSVSPEHDDLRTAANDRQHRLMSTASV